MKDALAPGSRSYLGSRAIELIEDPAGPATLRSICECLRISLTTNDIFDFIHFAGHGDESPFKTLHVGPSQSNMATDKERPLPTKLVLNDQGLASLFAQYQNESGNRIQGIVLNCCHSVDLAKALCDCARIPFVVRSLP